MKIEEVKYADDTTVIPETLVTNTIVDDVVFIAPRGNPNAEIMFISSCVLEEEATSSNSPAFLLKGPAGALFNRSLLKCGLDLEKCWTTTLVKHCLPRKQKLKPTPQQIERNKHLLKQEIDKVKPKIIVCLGKPVFDFFCNYKFKLREVIGGIFKNDEFNCLIYCMDDLVKLIYKPELLERLYVDLREIKRTIDSLNNVNIPKVPLDYTVINTKEKLIDWLESMAQVKLLSVDCEWNGSNFVDGQLRYTQFCWAPGKAVCLQFLDCSGKWMFDIQLEDVAMLLHDYLSRPDLKFCGHNIAADMVWLKYHLCLDITGKVAFDSMFAMHTVDETSDLKLERLAVRFTDLGRYDMDLLLWKKKNKVLQDEGYARIPDDILIPYSMKDVDTVIRCYPILLRDLMRDNLQDYYHKIKLPFVTDGFSSMCETGIPVNVDDIDKQRDVFLFVRTALEKILIESLEKEALSLLLCKLVNDKIVELQDAIKIHDHLKSIISDSSKDRTTIITYLKQQLGRSYAKVVFIAEHLVDCPNFNYKSSDYLRRWLFEVKGYIPIVSTKTDESYPVPWEKILGLPLDQQKNYKPSTDKDTLKIYADRGDRVVAELLELKAINTITRTFLRPNDEDDNKEGLHKYIAKDSRVHTSYALTETNRPRSYHPNLLNIPKYLVKTIEQGFVKVRDWYKKTQNLVPPILINPKPIRWNFKAPEGYCFVESDYKTAEVFAIAYIAGDTNLIKTLTEPDTQYALKKVIKNDVVDYKPVRILYNSNTDIDEDKQDPQYLHPLDDPDYLRDKDGNLVHPRRDIHWELAECRYYMNAPRESLDKDIHRGGGKVGNFSVPYQASPGLIDRNIEINSGKKPPEGTGKNIIEAYNQKNKITSMWLDNQKTLVEEDGYLTSISGAKRHFHYHSQVDGLSEYTRKSILEALKRQSCNWPIQSIVADSLAKATVHANKLYRERGMKARVALPLYDALYTLCHISEIEQVKEIHQIAMCDINHWDFGDRTLVFDLDTEVTIRWACKMDENDKKEFEKYSCAA